MKKSLSIILVSVMVAVMCLTVPMLSACTPADYVIGISQFVEIDALDSATQGFKDTLEAWAKENDKKIEFVVQLANQDISNAATIATNLVARGCDLLLGNATPCAVALASATTTIPVLFTSVTDPAVDIFGEGTRANVTGTSDKYPVEKPINLVKKVVEAKGETLTCFAMVYSSNETNSIAQYNEVKSYCDDNLPNVELKSITVASDNDIPTALSEVALDGVQAVYIPTDNVVSANIAVVTSKTQPLDIPVITAEEGMCTEDNTGLCSISIDYYELGVRTGKMAITILSGEKAPSDIPFETLSDYKFAFNDTTAEAIGLSAAQIAAIKTYGDSVCTAD